MAPLFRRPLRRGLLALAFAVVVAAAPGNEANADQRPSLEAGLPFVQVFGPADYDEHTQNWAVTQDHTGVLYIGNNNGVILAYDGQSWRSHRVAGPGAAVRGLAFDEHGRLWFGASGDLGYLDDDGRGGLGCTSLRDKLPEEVRGNFLMYHVVHRPDGVFFFTGNHVLRWHDGKFDVEKFRLAWPSQPGARLLRHAANRPLEEWRDGGWRTLADTPEMRRIIVRFSTELPDGALLLATARDGFFRLDGAQLTPWPTEIDAFLKTAGIERGLRLRDGSLVLSHRPNGFSILDAAGRLRHYLSEENSPLPTPIAWAFFQDRHDDLWVMLDRGLARIARPGAITVYGQSATANRLDVMSLCPFQHRLHVGTTNGLWRLEWTAPSTVPPRQAHLERVPGPDGTLWMLFNTPDELLLGRSDGVACYRPDGSPVQRVIKSTTARSLWISPTDPRHALAGVGDGVRQLRRDADGWREVATLPKIAAEARNFLEDADGALWVSIFNAGYYRLIGVPGTGSADGQPIRVEHYAGGHGFATERFEGNVQMGRFAGRVCFPDRGRMFHFDPASRRFVDDGDIAARLGVPGATITRFVSDCAENLWIYLLRPDAAGWPAKGRQAFFLPANGQPRRVPFWLAEYLGPNVAVQYTSDSDGRDAFWLSGADGVARVELPDGLPEPTPFRTFLRRVEDARGQALPLAAPAALPYAHRDIELTVATDRFGDKHLVFQSRLDDEEWSAWNESPRFNFARLGIGAHAVEVRARDSDGVVTAPVRFVATVLAPWWLTWWALALDAAALGASVFALIRWRLRTVRRRNVELERLVATRTAELSARKNELKAALAAAEGASRAKNVFLASMSHELRTPLNAILGYAQILRRAPAFDADTRRQLETIQSSGDHLLTMINDLLDLAKIEAGKVELHPQPVVLARLLAHLTEVFEPRAAQKGIAFSLRCETSLPQAVLVDEVRLRQVLYNLLGNALKFTERGRIEFSVGAVAPTPALPPADSQSPTSASTLLRFTIADTGVGIAPDQQAKIFGLFQQAGSPALARQGAGLGLAISQRLVRLMGGEISVESSLREGSRFSFTLPLTIAGPVAPAAAARIPIGYCGRRRRVLVVDDEPVNRQVLRDLLATLGFEISERDNGEAAVEACAAPIPPDLVLIDLRMERLDGLTAARRIRALPRGANVRLIAISASVFPVDRTEALDAGCDDFEPKPFRVESLVATIGRVLALDWEYAVAPTGSRSPLLPDRLPAHWPLPPRDVLARLAEQADFGDLAALRATLASARIASPDAAAFLDVVEAHAARARLASLREWIAAAGARTDSSA